MPLGQSQVHSTGLARVLFVPANLLALGLSWCTRLRALWQEHDVAARSRCSRDLSPYQDGDVWIWWRLFSPPEYPHRLLREPLGTFGCREAGRDAVAGHWCVRRFGARFLLNNDQTVQVEGPDATSVLVHSRVADPRGFRIRRAWPGRTAQPKSPDRCRDSRTGRCTRDFLHNVVALRTKGIGHHGG